MESIPKTLAQLRRGEQARVVAARSPTRDVLRLMEMGMVPGARLTVTRRAPLGDPMEVELGGARLCLRAEDAAHFEVAR